MHVIIVWQIDLAVTDAGALIFAAIPGPGLELPYCPCIIPVMLVFDTRAPMLPAPFSNFKELWETHSILITHDLMELIPVVDLPALDHSGFLKACNMASSDLLNA